MHYHRPHHRRADVIFIYRNFMAIGPNYCHIGLGVNSLHSVKVLRKNGVKASAHGVRKHQDINVVLAQNPGCTHCIIEAPWVKTHDLEMIVRAYPDVHFVVRCHSQIGFLQVEPGAINLIREGMEMQDHELNFTMSANSRRANDFLQTAYDGHCKYLPNLYDACRATHKKFKHPNHRDCIDIASFGALRLLKNHTTAAAAAMLIARNLGCHVNFYVSVNREEHGKAVLHSLRNMFRGSKYAALVENPWERWGSFRKTVQEMDLCIQLSATETFNITTADAAAAQVPCVVGDCIDWAPKSWQCPIDDAEEAARKGCYVLNDFNAGIEGREALEEYCAEGVRIWLKYLDSNPTT